MTHADKRAIRARLRSIDSAINFFKNRRGFAAVQLRAMRGQDEWLGGLSGQEQARASPQRLGAVLRLIDIRAEAYLTLVDDVVSQDAFMAMMNSFTDQAWQDYVGFSVYQAPPLQDDPNYRTIRERGRRWVSKGYERLDAEERKAPESPEGASDMPEKPIVFISYSWDGDSHKQWVLQLAKRLRAHGVDAVIDQMHMHLGGDTPQFMEKSITESRFVLVVCTKNYKERFDGRFRGSGYEGHIITAQMVSRVGTGKFIPVLRDEKWEIALPIALDGIFGADLSKDSDDEYNKLLIWPS